jgi:hypothetical protein
LPKSKATKKSKKPAKAAKLKKSSSAAAKKTQVMKMPVSTFDAWVAKQVRSGKIGGATEVATKSVEIELPKDTFEVWIGKQKPREGTQQKSTSAPVQDTYEIWMSKQVAMRSSAPDEEQQSGAADTLSASVSEQ